MRRNGAAFREKCTLPPASLDYDTRRRRLLAHRPALMFTVAPAASWQRRIGIRKRRTYQREAEQNQQQYCRYAPHPFMILPRAGRVCNTAETIAVVY